MFTSTPFVAMLMTLSKKRISQDLLKKYATNGELVVSEVILYEFAYVAHKLGESKKTIENNLEFLSLYVDAIDTSVHLRVLEIFESTSLYVSSFDVFHLAFSEYQNCNLITFDKGFKKLKEIAKTPIEIL